MPGVFYAAITAQLLKRHGQDETPVYVIGIAAVAKPLIIGCDKIIRFVRQGKRVSDGWR